MKEVTWGLFIDSIDSVSGIIFFYDFVGNSVRIFFLPTSQHWQAKFWLFLGICWYGSFIYRQDSSFETVTEREAILNPVPKQWISTDIPSYASQLERAKIAIHWFGDYYKQIQCR